MIATAAPARAQLELSEPASSTLLVVRTPGDQRVVSRIVGELMPELWNVIEVGPAAQLEHAGLAQLAASHAAIAALRVDSANATIELWIARAEGSAEGSLETLSTADSDERVPAFRVTEALRARGLTGERPPHTPEPTTAKSESESDSASDSESESGSASDSESRQPPVEGASQPETLPAFPRLWVEVAPALALSPGGIGPELGAWFDVRYQPAPIGSLSLFALAPIWSPPLRAPEGSARVSVLLLGAGADLQWSDARWELALRAGAGGVFAFMSGAASGAFRGDDDTVIVAALLAGPSLHYDLGGRFRVCARAIGAIALPRVGVHFANRDVAHWGRPFLLATLGLERAF